MSQGQAQGHYVYGRHPVEELLRGQAPPASVASAGTAGNARLDSVTALARQAGVPVRTVSKRAWTTSWAGGAPGRRGGSRRFTYTPLEAILERAGDTPPLLLVLDQCRIPTTWAPSSARPGPRAHV